MAENTENVKNGDGDAPVVKTTKAVSEAVNRAVERYKKQLDERIEADAQTARLLKAAGLPEDIRLAAAELIEQSRQMAKCACMRDERRDSIVLGRADAEEAIARGECENCIAMLEGKPAGLRTRRDAEFYARLKAHLSQAEAKRRIEAMGIDYEALRTDSRYLDFVKNLDPGLGEDAKYELYARYAVPGEDTGFIAVPAVSAGNTQAGADFFSAERVKSMSREEVDKNIKSILRSMTKWKKEKNI